MRYFFSIPVALLFAWGSAIGQPADEAKVIIAKAIKAHGGDNRLRRPACSLKVKGTFYRGHTAAPVSGSIKQQGADRARIEITTPSGTSIAVVNGDNGWDRQDDTTRAMTTEELADAKEDLYTDWVSSLVALPGDGFTFARLAPPKVGERAVVGLRVSRKGHRDIDLFFDRETWLLVKKRITRSGPDGKEMEYVTLFTRFRDFDGVKISTKWVTHRDGQKLYEGEVTEAHFLARLPPDTFAKP